MPVKFVKSAIVAFIGVWILGACGDAAISPEFHAEENPKTLGEWSVIKSDRGKLKLAKGVVSYDLNTALFSDYAHKLRTVWVPEGASATYSDNEAFDFPVGTIISKTFYYPIQTKGGDRGDVLKMPDDTSARLIGGFDLGDVRLIETRLLVHREDGWVALPYIWNDDQSDAVLRRAGDMKALSLFDASGNEEEFSYIVPNANQCAGCHATNATTREIKPIGPKARHLNKLYRFPDGVRNQLAAWQAYGILSDVPEAGFVPANALWADEAVPLPKRARSYLDINCSHCHNRQGAADTSGLYLEPDTPISASLGVCKLPIAAGTGTGDRRYGIVPGEPDESIFIFRMESKNPAVMMPELGRSIVHEEGLSLIEEWIANIDGKCL